MPCLYSNTDIILYQKQDFFFNYASIQMERKKWQGRKQAC